MDMHIYIYIYIYIHIYNANVPRFCPGDLVRSHKQRPQVGWVSSLGLYRVWEFRV